MKLLYLFILLNSLYSYLVDDIAADKQIKTENKCLVLQESKYPHYEGIRSYTSTYTVPYQQIVIQKHRCCFKTVLHNFLVKEFLITAESLKVINIFQLVPKIHSP